MKMTWQFGPFRKDTFLTYSLFTCSCQLHIWEGKSSEQTWQREKQFGGRGFGIYELIRTISISSPCLGSGDFGKRNGCGNGLSMWGCQETDVKCWDVSRLVFHAKFFRKKLVKTSWELRRSGEWRRITQLSLFLSYSIGSSKFVGKHIFYVLHWPLSGFSSVLPEYFPHFWKILDVSYIWYLQQV